MLDRAEEEAETPMPGYTHLQRAQPVTVGHHLLAWVEMLDRDRARFRFAAERRRRSPLGAGALAGSTLDLPAPPGAMRNSLDAVADRDFALDYLYACAVLFVAPLADRRGARPLGRERVRLRPAPGDAATGSSMMPQKLNPDVAELVRGKAGTALGRLAGPARRREGPAARVQPRPAGGQAAGVRGAPRHALGAAGARASSSRASSSTASGWPPRARTRCCARRTPPRRSSRAAMPFRDAHEQVATSVRDGTFADPETEPSDPAPGPAGIGGALASARARFGV